ncbi:phosphoheptose isomerase [Terrimonas sp.]|uniref:SIS domain-containing protein n=1 Tax=Terrimonas sp. TaxID=1914338 RepID=UPI000D510500|nr:SIS domain-containing protein [Terrimonas sp.]PVD52818.1 phosphoheptose isomerase [Terrimonas sp.]
MKEVIYAGLNEARTVLDEFMRPETVSLIDEAATLISDALQSGRKIISCGNGGSLCDAAHFAEELTGRFRKNRKPYPALAINDPAYITCVGNDYSFEEIFSRYIEGAGEAGDVLLAISTSGHSKNVVKAAQAARTIGMKVVALTSVGSNQLSPLADIVLASPKTEFSDRVQEIHIKVIHLLIQSIEIKLGHH